ncbi:UPF0450 protein C17orf58 homolog [Pelodytes ibericus]
MISQAAWFLLFSTILPRNIAQSKGLLPNEKSPLLLSSEKLQNWENLTSRHESQASERVFGRTVRSPLENYTGRRLLSVSRHQPWDNGKITMQVDKKTKLIINLDNNTGLRKAKRRRTGGSPTHIQMDDLRVSQNNYGNSQKSPQERYQNEDTSDFLHFHQTNPLSHKEFNGSQDPPDLTISMENGYDSMDHESNRPGKVSSHKPTDVLRNSSKPSWITNRHPSSLLYQFQAFRRGSDSKEKLCLTECNKEKDERDSYCNSDFAVNGIVHEVETISKGMQLITLLVNSAGLYKMNRLYITPDGFFFRVKILAVDTLRCQKSCLDFKLGNRYIVMGEIYHKRTALPEATQQLTNRRLRAGDGLVRSSSYVRRFNRKKDRKVLAVAHAKCK